MNKIKIKKEFVNLDCIAFMTLSTTRIQFETSSGGIIQYELGRNLTQEEFDTLTLWLGDPANNPHVIAVP